jgi:hypothetical protein
MVMRNLWREELDVVRAIEEAGVGEANGGIRIVWWGIACIASAMLWTGILMVVG